MGLAAVPIDSRALRRAAALGTSLLCDVWGGHTKEKETGREVKTRDGYQSPF